MTCISLFFGESGIFQFDQFVESSCHALESLPLLIISERTKMIILKTGKDLLFGELTGLWKNTVFYKSNSTQK